jgi:general stress protein 26
VVLHVEEGRPVEELKADPVVNLVYADPHKDTYVSVSGTAAMIEDAAKKEQLWSKLAAAWFPGGPATPTSRWSRCGSPTPTTGT